MYTIGSSCRRRGISTIFGVIIFVGIMFTAVIPMFLVMKQADILHEIRKVEVGRLDEEHALENIFFNLETSIDPETEEPIIKLVFYNKCVIAVKIIHLWINDELRDVNYLIPPTSNEEWDLRNLIDPPYQDTASFSVMAVTDKGNIFLPTSGNPEYSYDPESGLGSWEHNVYTIYIMMTEKRTQLHVMVIFLVPEGDDIIVFDDGLVNNLYGYWINVPFEGNYHIIVTQFQEYNPPLFEATRPLGPPNNLATLVII